MDEYIFISVVVAVFGYLFIYSWWTTTPSKKKISYEEVNNIKNEINKLETKKEKFTHNLNALIIKIEKTKETLLDLETNPDTEPDNIKEMELEHSLNGFNIKTTQLQQLKWDTEDDLHYLYNQLNEYETV